MFMCMTQGVAMPPTIRLHPEADQRLKTAFGIDTETALAERAGVNQGQYNRIKNGRSAPGPYAQARLLIAAEQHGLGFYDLFEVVTDTDDQDA
jgi:transcriptional regulator with XRE-family HTH domain